MKNIQKLIEKIIYKKLYIKKKTRTNKKQKIIKKNKK